MEEKSKSDIDQINPAKYQFPEKNIPAQPDKNPDPTMPRPGGNEPEKNDPTRIEDPPEAEPARIEEPQPARPAPSKTKTTIFKNK